MVWEPLRAAVLQRLPAVNALKLLMLVCVRTGREFHFHWEFHNEGSGYVPSTQSRTAPENWEAAHARGRRM
jgi:hypothetical protein